MFDPISALLAREGSRGLAWSALPNAPVLVDEPRRRRLPELAAPQLIRRVRARI